MGQDPNISTKTLIHQSHPPPQATIARHKPRVNPVWYEYPYYHINPMGKDNYENHLIDVHAEHIREDDKQEEIFEYLNDNTITEE